MAEKSYLLFDYGASHGRCMVANFDGQAISMQQIHEFDNIPVNYADVLYWDILSLVNDLKVGVKKACGMYPHIESIGVDTWGCDFGLIDQRGKLLANPVNYRDEARYKYKKELDDLFGEYEIFKLGGANTNNIMGLYELYAQKKEDSAVLRGADRLLMMPDLFNHYLTGIPTNEYTNATMTLMVNQTEKQWEKTFFDRLGLPDKLFGPLTMPGTRTDCIQERVCRELGVPAIPVVNVATHDTASAIAGVPLEDDQKPWAFLSMGTWAILGMESDRVYQDKKTFASGFANQGGCEGKNNFVNLFTGLWVIQQCYERWNEEAGKKIGWNTVDASLSGVEGGTVFIDLDAEEFAQPHPNMPLRIQEYCSARGLLAPQGMGGVAKCVYESLALKVKRCYEDMQSLTGTEIETLYVFGGGSKSTILCQWIADALDVCVKAGPAETTSMGNVLLQMKGMGEIASLREGRAISAKSAQTKEYRSEDKQKWAQYYPAYLKMLQGV